MYTEDLVSKIKFNNVMISNHSFEFLLSLTAHNYRYMTCASFKMIGIRYSLTAVTVVSVDIILVRFMIAFLKSVIMFQHTEQEYNYLCS